MTSQAFAKIHEFETTHLKSAGGTGVAGIFMEEAAFLNPASLAFFTQGSVYVQRDMLQMKDAKGNVVQKPKNTAAVISDGNASLSGSLSYAHQEEGSTKRSRWGLSTSSPLSQQSAFGASVRKIKDENTITKTKVDYYQTVFGVTHAINAQTSLGIVAYDAFDSKADATKAFVGFQHIFAEYVTAAFDLGANWKAEEISDTLLYRGSIQIRVLNDFYLRFGAFKDKELEEKGNGMGLAWIQPKLAFELAVKNTKQDPNLSLARAESKIKETSFSVSFRF